MRTTATLVALAALVCAGAGLAGQSGEGEKARERLERDSRLLRGLLPKLLRSSDTDMVHEALLVIREDAGLEIPCPPGTLAEVIAALDRLLDDPEDSEATTRRLACGTLWRHGCRDAIPVLLKALEDPYVRTDLVSRRAGAPAQAVWYAVWKSADHALREITGANPIEAPDQLHPIEGQREAVRKAWTEWYERAEKDD